MGVVGVCFFVFRESIMLIWAEGEPEVLDSGAKLLICAAVYQVFHAARITYSGALRGAGDTLWLAIISAIGTGLVLGLGGYLTTILVPQIGALGPWLAATVSIVFVGIANRVRFRSNRWMQINLLAREGVSLPSEEEAAVE